MPLSAEELYMRLGALITEMPDVETVIPTPEVYAWLGKAAALVDELGGIGDTVALNVASQNLGRATRQQNGQTIKAIVYRALAKAELRAPVAVQGAFIPAGNVFQAVAAVGAVLTQAQNEVLIIDPYADTSALEEFAVQAREGIRINILADAAHHKPGLKPAAERWIAQYGPRRPLEVRLAPARSLHDRLILVDLTSAWSLGQSLNNFAVRAPTSIIRVDADTTSLKASAYAAIWQTATVLT